MRRSNSTNLPSFSQWMIGLFPFLAVIGFLVVRVGWFKVYVSMIQEDAWIENVEAILYLASAVVCTFLAYRLRRNKWLVVLFLFGALFMLLICAEEISWGQRILMIKTPRYFKRHNFQHELSLHNLKSIQVYLHSMYVIAGGILAFGWVMKKKFGRRINLFKLLPDSPFMGYFLPTFLLYLYFVLSTRLSTIFQNDLLQMEGYLIWRDQEPAELLLALGCFVWLLALNHNLTRQRTMDTPVKEQPRTEPGISR